MAFKIGITGLPSSGKSYAWTTYQHGDEVAAIIPSVKIVHVRKSDGKLLEAADFAIRDVFDSARDYASSKGFTFMSMVEGVFAKEVDPADIKVTGDTFFTSDVTQVTMIKRFISTYMPEKKVILNPDFSHWVSFIMQSREFRSRSKGNQAYARFWDMAANLLSNVILSGDTIREDIIDVTEFHSHWVEEDQRYRIFSPGGEAFAPVKHI